MPKGITDQFGRALAAGLGQHVLPVGVDCMECNAQISGNLLAAQAFGQSADNLPLADSEQCPLFCLQLLGGKTFELLVALFVNGQEAEHQFVLVFQVRNVGNKRETVLGYAIGIDENAVLLDHRNQPPRWVQDVQVEAELDLMAFVGRRFAQKIMAELGETPQDGAVLGRNHQTVHFQQVLSDKLLPGVAAHLLEVASYVLYLKILPALNHKKEVGPGAKYQPGVKVPFQNGGYFFLIRRCRMIPPVIPPVLGGNGQAVGLRIGIR